MKMGYNSQYSFVFAYQQDEDEKMPRKKPDNNERPEDYLSPSDVCLILNAEVHGREYFTKRELICETDYKNLKGGARERNRRRNRAYAQQLAWKQPSVSFPVGTARFLINDPRHEDHSKNLGLFEKAKDILAHHNQDCPRCCCDLFHAGDLMPEFGGIAMIGAIANSTSNYSLVSATAPLPISSAIIDDAAGDAFSSGSLLQQDIFGSTSNIDSGQQPPQQSSASSYSAPAAAFDRHEFVIQSIYNSPASLCPSQNQTLNDISVNDFVGTHPDLFLNTRLQWMSPVSPDFQREFTFLRLIQHWAVNEGIHVKALTRLLGLIHHLKPVPSKYQDFPMDGRTLLAIPRTHPVYRCKAGDDIKPRDIKEDYQQGKGFEKSGQRTVASYIHFGLEDGLIGKSIGLVHRFHYITLLRRIHTVFPFLLPDCMLELTKPGEEEPYDKKLWVNWLLGKHREASRECEQIIFEVKINVDGVQWFKSSSVNGTPVLGKLMAIRTLSGKTRVKIPYHLAKPFVIGILEKKVGKKISALEIVKETMDELMHLQPDSLKIGGPREGAPYAVEVACFCCDGPMRCELKGIKSSGYWSCERCRTEGVYLNKKGVAVPRKPTVLTLAQKADIARKQAIQDEMRMRQTSRTAGAPASSSADSGCQSGTASSADEEHQQDKTASRASASSSSAAQTSSASATITSSMTGQTGRSRLQAGRKRLISSAVDDEQERSLLGPSCSPAKKRRSSADAPPVKAAKKKKTNPFISKVPVNKNKRFLGNEFSATFCRKAVKKSRMLVRKKTPLVKPAAVLLRTACPGGSHKGSVYFPEINAAPRIDEAWHSYLQAEVLYDVSICFKLYIIYIHMVTYINVG